MRILLVNGNTSRCARSGYGPTPAPAGLISLGGVLREHGHQVTIRQIANHVPAQDEDSLPLLRAELEPILEACQPDVIGISCRNIGAARRRENPFKLFAYYSVFYDERLVRGFRMLSDAPIVMGGTAYSIEPALYTRYAKPDYGLVGEAEDTLPALLDAISTGQAPSDIPGLVRELGDVDHAWQNCGRTRDLSVMRLGAADLLENFRECYYDGGGYAPILTKRGCHMNCVYCTTPDMEGACYRYRPMENVIQEMKAYRDRWGVQDFFIVDSTFNDPPEHAYEICDAIASEVPGARWFTEVTPKIVTDDLVRAMKRAGCTSISFTPDACSETVLKSYGKGFGIAEVRNAIEILKRHELPFDTCVIVGGPGETRETLAEGLAFCGEHLSDQVVRFYDGMIVTARSPVYSIAVKEGVIDPEISYDELVLSNNFRGIKAYEYFFPHIQEQRKEFAAEVRAACTGPSWLVTSQDYVPDPQTGEFSLHPDIQVEAGARPWWRGMTRKSAGMGGSADKETT